MFCAYLYASYQIQYRSVLNHQPMSSYSLHLGIIDLQYLYAFYHMINRIVKESICARMGYHCTQYVRVILVNCFSKLSMSNVPSVFVFYLYNFTTRYYHASRICSVSRFWNEDYVFFVIISILSHYQ